MDNIVEFVPKKNPNDDGEPPHPDWEEVQNFPSITIDLRIDAYNFDESYSLTDTIRYLLARASEKIFKECRIEDGKWVLDGGHAPDNFGNVALYSSGGIDYDTISF